MQLMLSGFLALSIMPLDHCSSEQNHVVAPVPQAFNWLASTGDAGRTAPFPQGPHPTENLSSKA